MDENCKIDIDKKYLPSIGNFFSPIVLHSFEQYNNSSYFTEVCQNSRLFEKLDLSISLSEFFNMIFRFLLKNYRNEYIYKNIIANKILLGKHSLKTSQILTEFRIGKNKADFIILNGATTVYEIKSEYDSFSRLDKQINTYSKAFEFVNVITSPFQTEKAFYTLPDNIGILSLTNRNTISIIRKPKSNLKSIDLSMLFDSLRKNEYLQIIKAYYGYIPNVPNTKIFSVCKELYCEMPIEKAVKLTNEILKKRNYSDFIIQQINKVPYSLVAYILSLGSNKTRIEKFLNILNKKIIEII